MNTARYEGGMDRRDFLKTTAASVASASSSSSLIAAGTIGDSMQEVSDQIACLRVCGQDGNMGAMDSHFVNTMMGFPPIDGMYYADHMFVADTPRARAALQEKGYVIQPTELSRRDIDTTLAKLDEERSS